MNIHKSTEQLAKQKRLRNRKYQNNLNERKKFWQSQNSNYAYREQPFNQSTKARSKANPSHCSRCHTCNPKANFVPQTHPSLQKKHTRKPNTHPSYTSPNDVKGKGKLGSNSKSQTQKLTTNPKRVKKEFVKNQAKNEQIKSNSKEMKNNKIKVFTIKKKDQKTLIKRTYMIDLSIAYPVSVKGS